MEVEHLHNGELNDMYSSPNIIRVSKSRRMIWAVHVAGEGEMRHTCRILVDKPEGKRPLGRSRRGWEHNVKMNLQEIGSGSYTGLICLRMRRSGRLL
jgi:hypothetical protein